MFKIEGVKLADSGYYINLEESEDRRIKVNEQIEKFNIEGLSRYEAVINEFLPAGPTISHLKLMEELLEIEDQETFFIAEDDFNINEVVGIVGTDFKLPLKEYLKSLSESLENNEWDVVQLGCNPSVPFIFEDKNLGYMFKSTGAWAYLINKRACRYILDNFSYMRDRLAIDNIIPILNMRGFKSFMTSVNVIDHAVGMPSTVQRHIKACNYKSWIEGNYHKNITTFVENCGIDLTREDSNLLDILSECSEIHKDIRKNVNVFDLKESDESYNLLSDEIINFVREDVKRVFSITLLKNVPGWHTSDGIKSLYYWLRAESDLNILIDNEENKLPEFADEQTLIEL